MSPIVGEYTEDCFYPKWFKFYDKDIVDSIDGYYKIKSLGSEGEPRWFKPEQVIVYRHIDPLQKAIAKEKQKRQTVWNKRRNYVES